MKGFISGGKKRISLCSEIDLEKLNLKSILEVQKPVILLRITWTGTGVETDLVCFLRAILVE